MKIDHDEKEDCIYIYNQVIAPGEVKSNKTIWDTGRMINVDLDLNGNLIGIEIL